MGKLKVHGNQKYPWDRWLKEGTSHNLMKGRHFEVAARNFVINLYQRVRKYGVKVKVEYLKDDKGIKLTVYKVGGRKSA